MEPIKKAFIEAMVRTFGNITKSCDAVQISRRTYYNWIEEDAEFNEQIKGEEFEERLLDLIDEKLTSEVENSNTAVLIFMAKTKGKKRGYVERTEVENSGSISVHVSKEEAKEISKALNDKY